MILTTLESLTRYYGNKLACGLTNEFALLYPKTP